MPNHRCFRVRFAVLPFVVTAAVVLAMLGGCGIKGPLRLPPKPASAPASSSSEGTRSTPGATPAPSESPAPEALPAEPPADAAQPSGPRKP